MRKIIQKSQYELKEINCNSCGKKIEIVHGMPSEGVASIDCDWGYASEKDGEKHSFDLCEKCYDEMICQFVIPVEQVIQTEYI
jgi:hypothetical protein